MSLNPAYAIGLTLPAPLSEIASSGFFDYNDLATATTPISITGGAGLVTLTNDGLGAFTNKTYRPQAVTEVWDAVADEFDWTELKNGDTVEIRVDIEVTTTTANQLVQCDLEMASSDVGAYKLPVFQNIFKSAGPHRIIRYVGVYMGDDTTRTNPAIVQVESDANATVKVNGWYVNITRRG